MEFTKAVELLQQNGYVYHGRRMLSGYDFDTPSGEQIYLTFDEILIRGERLNKS